MQLQTSILRRLSRAIVQIHGRKSTVSPLLSARKINDIKSSTLFDVWNPPWRPRNTVVIAEACHTTSFSWHCLPDMSQILQTFAFNLCCHLTWLYCRWQRAFHCELRTHSIPECKWQRGYVAAISKHQCSRGAHRCCPVCNEVLSANSGVPGQNCTLPTCSLDQVYKKFPLANCLVGLVPVAA